MASARRRTSRRTEMCGPRGAARAVGTAPLAGCTLEEGSPPSLKPLPPPQVVPVTYEMYAVARLGRRLLAPGARPRSRLRRSLRPQRRLLRLVTLTLRRYGSLRTAFADSREGSALSPVTLPRLIETQA